MDPPPVKLPGELVSASTSRRGGKPLPPPPRLVPRPAALSHKRKRRAAGEQWDSGSEEGSSEEEGMFGGRTAVDGCAAGRGGWGMGGQGSVRALPGWLAACGALSTP